MPTATSARVRPVVTSSLTASATSRAVRARALYTLLLDHAINGRSSLWRVSILDVHPKLSHAVSYELKSDRVSHNAA